MKTLLAFASALVVASCGPTPINDYVSPTPITSTAAATIQLSGGSRVDQRLDIAAEVLTKAGQPVVGQVVTFSVTNGTVTPATVTTGADGYARAIASAPWANTITANAAGLSDAWKLGGVAPTSLMLAVSVFTVGDRVEDEEVQFGVSIDGCACTPRVVEWTFGDGGATTANTLSPRHTYSSDGSYTVTLSVVDDLGRTATASRRVTIAPRPLPPSPPPAQQPSQVSVTITCTHVTPLRKSCTATPTYNGVAIPGALVSTMTINWGDLSAEPATPGTSIDHTYALGTFGTYTIRVSGRLVTGETFDRQISISVG